MALTSAIKHCVQPVIRVYRVDYIPVPAPLVYLAFPPTVLHRPGFSDHSVYDRHIGCTTYKITRCALISPDIPTCPYYDKVTR